MKSLRTENSPTLSRATPRIGHRLETSLRVASALLIIAVFCAVLIVAEIFVVVIGVVVGAWHRLAPVSQRRA